MKNMAHRDSPTRPAPGESLAQLFLGAAVLVLWFVVLVVLLPVMVAG